METGLLRFDEPDGGASERSPSATRMFQEAGQAAGVVRNQLASNEPEMARLAQALRERQPRAVVTLGRGSSDHAATFAKYLIETRLGVVTSSAAPSVSSVYASAQDMRDTVCLAISQSGRSPDLLAAVEAAKTGGALVIALVNVEDSPLATLADEVVPLHAGPELSVAATKSYIAALTAITQLVGYWTKDEALLGALTGLPGLLERAWALEWPQAIDRLRHARNLYVIGRGVGYGVAQEAALKFKETCGLHAEAFSAAEVRHGPMALVEKGFPVLVFSQDDETRAGIDDLVADFAGRRADVMLAGVSTRVTQGGVIALPSLQTHPVLEPVLFVQSFYRMVNQLALARGYDPDQPPHLDKVTETV